MDQLNHDPVGILDIERVSAVAMLPQRPDDFEPVLLGPGIIFLELGEFGHEKADMVQRLPARVAAAFMPGSRWSARLSDPELK